MDSRLGSFISDHHWKFIYNLPHLQQTKSPHQNQRVYSFTRRGRFLCWFERYSLNVLLRQLLRMASTLAVLGEFYKMVVDLGYMSYPRRRVSRTSFCTFVTFILPLVISLLHLLNVDYSEREGASKNLVHFCPVLMSNTAYIT